MDDNILNNMNDWAKKFDQINSRLDAISNPLKGLSLATSRMNEQINKFELAAKIGSFGAKLNIPQSIYGGLNMTNNVLNGFSSPIDISKSIFNIKISNDFAAGINHKFKMFDDLFQRQLSISETMSRSYFTANQMSIPSWVDKISQIETNFNINNLNLIGLLSAETLTRLAEKHENVEDRVIPAEENITELSKLIEENQALKSELDNLYRSFSKYIVSKVKKKKKIQQADLNEPKIQISKFIHKILFKDNSISLQSVYNLVCLLDFVFTVIILGIIMEGKGSDIYDSIVGEETKQTTQPINFHKNITTNIYYDIKCDFVIEDAKLYLRNSLKSKCLGLVKINTTVIIIKQKPKWCFIEVLVKNYNKKTKSNIEKVEKGWILKKHLDYFQ